jgi:hypothetical protein
LSRLIRKARDDASELKTVGLLLQFLLGRKTVQSSGRPRPDKKRKTVINAVGLVMRSLDNGTILLSRGDHDDLRRHLACAKAELTAPRRKSLPLQDLARDFYKLGIAVDARDLINFANAAKVHLELRMAERYVKAARKIWAR